MQENLTLSKLTGTDTVNQGRQVSQNGQRQGRYHHKQGGINGCAGPAVDFPKFWEEKMRTGQRAAWQKQKHHTTCQSSAVDQHEEFDGVAGRAVLVLCVIPRDIVICTNHI